MALLAAGLIVTALPSCATANEPASGPSTDRSASVSKPDRWASHVTDAAKRFAIPKRWIRAVMAAESSGDSAALSAKGAVGLMQIMPPTWAELRAKHGLGRDPWQPRDNIMAGAAYLREMYDRYGTVDAMLAAYNAGPARYDEHRRGRPLPAETVAYVAKIASMIGGKAAIAPATSRRRSASSWSRAPLFAGRSTVHAHDDQATDDRPSGRPSDGASVVDLSVLEPVTAATGDGVGSVLKPSAHGLFVSRPPASSP